MQETLNYKSEIPLQQTRPPSLPGYVIPAAGVVVCLITRLLYFGRYIDEWDSVNFAFGLSKSYDILHDQPHFPGYPVYMFVSWIGYKLLGSDIRALILSGVLFSSFTLFSLYELARRLFSKEAAILAAIFYIVNPQVWLQAEKPLSDAFGLFFVVTAALFFFMALECANETQGSPSRTGNKENASAKISIFYLAMGGITLGLGLGVRVTYLALIPFMIFTGYVLAKRTGDKKTTVLGGSLGLSIGVVSWLGYLFVRFTPSACCKKLLDHADYHFYREGNSILTSPDYVERFVDIFYNLSAHCLGTWWVDAPLWRITPTVLTVLALVCFFAGERWNFKHKYLLAFFIPYFLWIALVQDAIRQIMVLIPFIIAVMGAGFIHGYVRYLKGWKWGLPAFFAVVAAFAVSQAVESLRIVSLNRDEEPPSVSTIRYITSNYPREDTKFYCLNDWRLFQYYAPSWCDKQNSHVYFVSRMSWVVRDLERLKKKPQHVLVSSKLFERHRYETRLKKLAEFKRDRYGVADYNRLALYSFEWR